MLKGIDLSKWQASNYQTLINQSGIDFVIARAGWRFSVDQYCDKIYQYAKSKGKKLGFYFFPLTSDGEPEKHAQWAYQQVLGYLGEAIPILDWESYSGQEGTNDESKVNWALRWLKEFERLSGVKPMIYMNSNCNKSYNWQPVYDNNNGLWIANYGNNDGSDHGRPAVKYWPSAAMHQYTSNPIDKDTFYGDQTAWDAYAKAQTPQSSSPDPTVALNQLISDTRQAVKTMTDQIHDASNLLSLAETTAHDILEKLNA